MGELGYLHDPQAPTLTRGVAFGLTNLDGPKTMAAVLARSSLLKHPSQRALGSLIACMLPLCCFACRVIDLRNVQQGQPHLRQQRRHGFRVVVRCPVFCLFLFLLSFSA